MDATYPSLEVVGMQNVVYAECGVCRMCVEWDGLSGRSNPGATTVSCHSQQHTYHNGDTTNGGVSSPCTVSDGLLGEHSAVGVGSSPCTVIVAEKRHGLLSEHSAVGVSSSPCTVIVAGRRHGLLGEHSAVGVGSSPCSVISTREGGGLLE